MSKLFRKQKSGNQSKALQKAAGWIDKRLRGLAFYLSRKTAQVQPRKMAITIMAACFLFSVCLSIAVFRTTIVSRNMELPAIRAPLIKTYRQSRESDVVIQRIRHFHYGLDSLRQNDFFHYDSLMKSRPHLLDSILTVEQLSNE